MKIFSFLICIFLTLFSSTLLATNVKVHACSLTSTTKAGFWQCKVSGLRFHANTTLDIDYYQTLSQPDKCLVQALSCTLNDGATVKNILLSNEDYQLVPSPARTLLRFKATSQRHHAGSSTLLGVSVKKPLLTSSVTVNCYDNTH